MKAWQLGVLTIIGLGIGAVTHGTLAAILRDFTLVVFLPILIIEAAWQLDPHEMLAAWRPISVLALPGVAITAGGIGVAAHVFGGFSWPSALIVGAILAATDPVAVVAIFRSMRMPKRLTTIIESEALLNDAIAVVLFRAVLGGTAFYAVIGSIGGIVVGAAIGVLASLLMQRRIPTSIRIAVVILAAYAAYLVDHHFGWSGIFAVLSAGIVLSFGARKRTGARFHKAAERVLSWLANGANILLFVLIGAAVDPFGSLGGAWFGSLVVLLAMLVVRALLAYGVIGFLTPLARKWLTVIRLAGVRGALSLTLALSLPQTLVQREKIIDAVFICVVITVLMASLVSPTRIKRLGLHSD